MPIRWSALKVSEAMDRVEYQVNLAEVFLPEARSIASQVRGVDNLPGYLDDRLRRLIYAIERLDEVKASINAVRKAIPDGAIEAERERLRRGSQQSLIPGPLGQPGGRPGQGQV